jgi:hypothetical protein
MNPKEDDVDFGALPLVNDKAKESINKNEEEVRGEMQ